MDHARRASAGWAGRYLGADALPSTRAGQLPEESLEIIRRRILAKLHAPVRAGGYCPPDLEVVSEINSLRKSLASEMDEGEIPEIKAIMVSLPTEPSSMPEKPPCLRCR